MKTLARLRWLLLAVPLLACSFLSAADAPAGGGAYNFKRGINISHWLSQNSAEHVYGDSAWFNESDVAWIAQHGFDHIRLPVDIRTCMTPDGALDDAKLKPIHDTIAWSKSRGLGVVLDAHFLPGADFNEIGGDKRVFTDTALQEKVAGVWAELARRFASEGLWLRMEILNEPVAEDNQQLNPFMHRMLAAIRQSNPTRIVYLTSNRWSVFSTLPDVVLPNDPNIALTLHNYEPLVFTHQRAPWVGFTDTLPPVHFPGTVPDYRAHLTPHQHHTFGTPGDKLTVEQMHAQFEAVSAWLAKHAPNIEVYLGEFGVYKTADAQSQRNWLSMMVHECESRGWGWAIWDYKGGFAVRDAQGNGTPVLEGLFQKN